MAKLTIYEDECKGCGLCVKVCPKKILCLSKERLNLRGYHPSEVTDQDLCIACAMCAVICPDVAIKIEK